jgi:hypothetical protein
MIAANLERGDIPQYWFDAIDSLNAQPHDTRVLEVPGIDFASYRWGNTVDPITPGLMDRPYAARELIPYGSPPSSDLLNAFDRRLQENTLDPRAVSPIARLFGIGQVVARNDLQYERYRIARPYQVMSVLNAAPGLGMPTGFGPLGVNQPLPSVPMQDEAALRDDNGAEYQPVVAYPVGDQQPIVRTASAQQPILVAGDGEGLVGLASAGLINGNELIQYTGTYAKQPQQLTDAINRDASLVVTDSNRRRARRWSTLRDNVGYTEQAGEKPLRTDLTDNRLPVFPDATDDSYTVSEYPGGVSARASSYGNPISFTPEFRPANAVDGDPRTSWRTGASADVRGEELELDFAQPVTTDHMQVTQLLTGFRNRSITKIDVRFDGKDTIPFDLDDSSRSATGQTLSFPQRTFSKVELIIRDDDSGRESKPLRPARFTGLSEVGFSEVDVNGIHGDEVIRMPTDLLAAAGASSQDHPLTLSMERARIDPAESVREDEELALARAWTLPTSRNFELTGTARLDTHTDETITDALLGIVGPTATSTRRLPGDLLARATSAIDGDPTTAWTPAFDTPPEGGDAIELNAGRPVTFTHMDLQVVADGRHSVPTHLRIEADGQQAANVELPAITDHPGAQGANAVVTVPIDLPGPVTGTDLRFVFDGVRQVMTTDWFSNAQVQMPIGIAELGVPALAASVPSGTFDTGCRNDLLQIDGAPVGVDISGTVADATSGKPLQVSPCGLSADGVFLSSGDHVLRAAKGLDSGIDLDSLVLQSAAGGGAPPSVAPLGRAAAGPAVKVDGQSRTSFDLRVNGATKGQPFWLVLGQSNNAGWTASVDGHDLGKSQLVDGYANGWLINPGVSDVKVALRWTPQRNVWIALALSAVGVLLCLVLAIRKPRSARLHVRDPAPDRITRRTFFGSRGRAAPSVRAALLVGAGAGVLAAAVIGIVAGIVTALAVGIAMRLRRARWVLAVGSPGLLALSGLYVLARQVHAKPTPAFEWPGELSGMHQVGWLAVAFLVGLVVVDWMWDRADRLSRRSESVDAVVVSADSADVSAPDDVVVPPG